MRLAEQLETLARYLVEAQLEIAAIAKELEKESISKTIPQNAGGAKASWNPGPPRVLKIVVPIFLPKLKVHPQVTWRKTERRRPHTRRFRTNGLPTLPQPFAARVRLDWRPSTGQ